MGDCLARGDALAPSPLSQRDAPEYSFDFCQKANRLDAAKNEARRSKFGALERDPECSLIA
jgi:hypothetical protein